VIPGRGNEEDSLNLEKGRALSHSPRNRTQAEKSCSAGAEKRKAARPIYREPKEKRRSPDSESALSRGEGGVLAQESAVCAREDQKKRGHFDGRESFSTWERRGGKNRRVHIERRGDGTPYTTRTAGKGLKEKKRGNSDRGCPEGKKERFLFRVGSSRKEGNRRTARPSH